RAAGPLARRRSRVGGCGGEYRLPPRPPPSTVPPQIVRMEASVKAVLLAMFVSVAVIAAEKPAAPKAAPVATDYNEVLKGLKFREIGPAAMGGRIDDFAVVESNPDIIYVGTASGGLFKTTNGGTTWEPLFDDQPNSTI